MKYTTGIYLDGPSVAASNQPFKILKLVCPQTESNLLEGSGVRMIKE